MISATSGKMKLHEPLFRPLTSHMDETTSADHMENEENRRLQYVYDSGDLDNEGPSLTNSLETSLTDSTSFISATAVMRNQQVSQNQDDDIELLSELLGG